MTNEIVVALLGLAGTLAGSFLGVLATGKLTQYRLQQLENKVNAHNRLVERTYALEAHMDRALRDIRELQACHGRQ